MRNLQVWFVLYYLRFWAQVALRLSRPYVIGVAGSVGKSSTRNALLAALQPQFKVKVVSGNSETGVPLGILGIPVEGFDRKYWIKTLLRAPFQIKNLRNTHYLIVEMGIDDPYPPKNMSYLLTIIKPDMAIDLNATATHTEQFEKVLKKHHADTREALISKIAEEDSKIITNGYTKVGIYNADDERLTYHIKKNVKKEVTTLLTFGESQNNAISYLDYSVTPKRTKFVYSLNQSGGPKTIELSFKNLLFSPASKECFAAVLLAAHALGLKYSQIKENLESNFTLPKGRSGLFSGIKSSLIIDSSYNSSKSTVLSFLEMAQILKKKTGRPLVFLMGDMRELGQEAEKEHKEVAHFLLPIVDELHCVGPLTAEFVLPTVKEFLGKKGKTKKAVWYKNSVQAGLHLKEELPNNAIVLVKGSQNTLFLEEAIKFLLENPAESKNLTRQEDYWMKTKQDFFSVS